MTSGKSESTKLVANVADGQGGTRVVEVQTTDSLREAIIKGHISGKRNPNAMSMGMTVDSSSNFNPDRLTSVGVRIESPATIAPEVFIKAMQDALGDDIFRRMVQDYALKAVNALYGQQVSEFQMQLNMAATMLTDAKEAADEAIKGLNEARLILEEIADEGDDHSRALAQEALGRL